MMVFGTFIGDGIPDAVDDLDFFIYPQIDASIPADSLDAPIDGFALAAGGQNQDAGKEFLKFLGTAEAQDAANAAADAPMIAANSNASQDTYTALQLKSAEVVGGRPHRPVPRPRHRHRLRLHRDDPVAAGAS